MQLDYRRPTKQQVTKRLLEICNKEGLRTNNAALEALTEMSQGDIRMVIGQLQMIRLRTDTFTYDDAKVRRKRHRHVSQWRRQGESVRHWTSTTSRLVNAVPCARRALVTANAKLFFGFLPSLSPPHRPPTHAARTAPRPPHTSSLLFHLACTSCHVAGDAGPGKGRHHLPLRRR